MSNNEIDYNLSIILPFYKKMTEFKFVLPLNYKYFSQKGIEIILVVDEPLKKSDFDFFDNYPKIRYKIIVNNKPHEWRNPAKVINVGIRHSIKKFILVMSPETVMINNVINLFHTHYKDNRFLTGLVTFIAMGNYNNTAKENYNNCEFINYGSIYIKKSDLIRVGGYNENFICWGGEDDEIRIRLIKNNVKKMDVVEAKMAHLDIVDRAEYRIKCYKGKDKKQYIKQRKYIKQIQKINFDNNGHDFNEILVDKTDQGLTLSLSFIDRGIKFMIDATVLLNHPLIVDYKFGNLVKKDYFVMNLFQIYNEEHNLEQYFKSIRRLADGVIILDDGSTDNSWVKLNNFDYTLKIRIKRDTNTFNDLRNRNLLLELLQDIFIDNNIYIRWVYWMDADEVIGNTDAELADIKKLLYTTKNEIFTIDLYHMWDNDHYNAEYPQSIQGKSRYFRLFKNIRSKRPFKIVSDKNLHFRLIPYDTKLKSHIPIKIKHYGMSTPEKRKHKYTTYTNNYDKGNTAQSSYAHMIKEKPKLKLFSAA